MKLLIQEAFGYAVASAAALATDMFILYVLVHHFEWWYLAAATLSFTAGVVVAYVISVSVVFKYRRMNSRRKEFTTFVVLGAVGLALNGLIIFVAVDFMHWNYMLAKCLAAGFTFVCNFFMRRQLLFVRRLAAS